MALATFKLLEKQPRPVFFKIAPVRYIILPAIIIIAPVRYIILPATIKIIPVSYIILPATIKITPVCYIIPPAIIKIAPASYIILPAIFKILPAIILITPPIFKISFAVKTLCNLTKIISSSSNSFANVRSYLGKGVIGQLIQALIFKHILNKKTEEKLNFPCR